MMKYAFLILAAVVLASGCASPAATTPAIAQSAGLTQVNMTLDHGSGYTPSEIRTKLNNTVKIFAISNQPAHQHGLTIDDFNVNVAVTAGPGSSPQLIEFKPDKVGTFTIHCKTCETGPRGAHPWFKGTLIVEP